MFATRLLPYQFFSVCVFSLSAFSVTWRKNNVEIRCDAFHVVKAEGEKHSLVIKEMRLSNAGSYCATAVNAAGRASCSATLYIQSGEAGPEPAFKPCAILEILVSIRLPSKYTACIANTNTDTDNFNL